ncbi:MAG: cobalt-precorrin-5B (C(1))-methyltransferase [Gloeomargaritaceae cyanobacterium C42_A2020_066]|nr:cobalt-precorrin-5B (C(1))-methyltransferase [Gloeomargaritaceae cyanobacterium C42_A2020_066]
MLSSPRSGYTLPVFACASALAALHYLRTGRPAETVEVDLLRPAERVTIAIEQVAPVQPGMVLGITRSDPGDNLDLTRHTPIWALVTWGPADQDTPIHLMGGEGIGVNAEGGTAAISRYARELLLTNLQTWLPKGKTLVVTVILPAGRSLATRTSNAAFGIVEGLALLGTTGISQPLSAPAQLAQFQQTLAAKTHLETLVFCIGENGLDLATQLGIPAEHQVKTANWLGPLLVAAGQQGVRSILLLGYHGKLIKLAGGIFHTHHHLADGRLEILVACGVAAGLPLDLLHALAACPTTEAALVYLRQTDVEQGTHWTAALYSEIGQRIEQRSRAYIHTHAETDVAVATMLFDRHRRIIAQGRPAADLLARLTQRTDR